MLYVNKNINAEIVENLKKLNIEFCAIATNDFISDATADHPDMAMVSLGDVLIASKHLGFVENDSIKLAKQPMSPYPKDVSLNFLVDERCAFGRVKSIDEVLFVELERTKRKVVDVKQGYAKCGAIFANGIMISADASLIAAAEMTGYDTLHISSGHIALEGYPYGFIGGASFNIGNSIYFFGELSTHPDGERIRNVLAAHGCDVIELCKGTLTDYGSAVYF